jgi:hypothetical protein
MALPPVAAVNCGALRVIEEETDCRMPGLVMSLEVTVAVPVAFKLTLKGPVPASNAAFGGKVAVASLEVIPTISVAVLTRFQFASTPLTVTLKGVLEI